MNDSETMEQKEQNEKIIALLAEILSELTTIRQRLTGD